MGERVVDGSRELGEGVGAGGSEDAAGPGPEVFTMAQPMNLSCNRLGSAELFTSERA